MKMNVRPPRGKETTFEGGPSMPLLPLQKLRRLVMACMLWEDTFYVDGKKSVELICEVCQQVPGENIVALAVECHEKGLLRHVPLLLLVEALKKPGTRCVEAIYKICSRPDQMTELLALYWGGTKKPLPAQLKKGLAKAFTRFDEYQLAKYDRDGSVKLRDVLFLCHAKPKDMPQAMLWKRLINREMATPETWETKLSAGQDKKETFDVLLGKKKMGKLAILRNLRNMCEAGISKQQVREALLGDARPLLPFQFIGAARACPSWEDAIEESMLQSVASRDKLKGITILLVDVSGSMDSAVSGKSQMMRMDAACAIAILLREVCDQIDIFAFSDTICLIPPRRGMALRDIIVGCMPHSGTSLGAALNLIKRDRKSSVDVARLIVITDEQTSDMVPQMGCGRCYIVNVGSYENGIKNVGNEWLTISGFSEHVVDYIEEVERADE
jgi:hypothetical protein